jgi:hypothetical protein
MVLTSSRLIAGEHNSLAHPSILLSALSSASQELLRRLLFVTPVPIDTAGLPTVLRAVCNALRVYGQQLRLPRQGYTQLLSNITALECECRNTFIGQTDFHYSGTRKKNTPPAWQLLLLIERVAPAADILETIGAELAISLTTVKPFRETLAKNLGQVINAAESLTSHPVAYKQALNVRREADRLFEGNKESGATPDPEASLESQFREDLARHFRAKVFYSTDKEHQAIPTHRCQSPMQLKASAKQLKEQILLGDKTALFTVITSLTGLPEEIAQRLPLLSHAREDWYMVLDSDSGCIKVDMALYARGGANSAPNTSSSFFTSGEINIIPLPQYVADALDDCIVDAPSAANLGALLLTTPPVKNRSLTRADAGIRATTARFRNALGALAIQEGISRYRAALLVADPRLVPSGKFFYSRITREEIWQDANTLYSALDWGKSVTFVPGLAIGSRVTPTDEAIQAWHRSLAEQVHGCRIGRRYTLAGLITYHNAFAHFAASMATFLLALRHRQVLPLSTNVLLGKSRTISIFDKRVGEFPGGRPVPVCTVLHVQLDYWQQHCHRLENRLIKLGLPDSHPARRSLERWRTKEVPLFFSLAENGKFVSIGTQALKDQWPSSMGLPGNFGRHFWQDRLRQAGIHDTEIDAFVRHYLAGMMPNTSTSAFVTSEWARRITSRIDEVTSRLGLTPLKGLSIGSEK